MAQPLRSTFPNDLTIKPTKKGHINYVAFFGIYDKSLTVNQQIKRFHFIV